MLWPESTARNDQGILSIGGIDVPSLVAEFGTPLYVFDEATLRHRAASVVAAFARHDVSTRVAYASKALLIPAILSVLHDEGLCLDVASGGELYAALASGFPASEITFHGNNKSKQELREAIESGVGLIAIDNEFEISLLAELTKEQGVQVEVLVRLNPGIDVHTHEKIATGVTDSKFGFPVWSGAAKDAVHRILNVPGLELVGFHAHIGSQIFDFDAYSLTIQTMLDFAAEVRDSYGFSPSVFSPGGGIGIAYESTDEEVNFDKWASVAVNSLVKGSAKRGLPVPELVVEPGRSIVGPSAIAVYTAGAVKDIPGVRKYVSIDGGMADNIRPSLYGAKYSAAIANRVPKSTGEMVTVAGKYCESGDVLIRDVDLGDVTSGDLIALPAVGAYCLAMASNYNLALRPAVVLVDNGEATLIRRRERYEDLLNADVLPIKSGLSS